MILGTKAGSMKKMDWKSHEKTKLTLRGGENDQQSPSRHSHNYRYDGECLDRKSLINAIISGYQRKAESHLWSDN